jgi:hypothetical protein
MPCLAGNILQASRQVEHSQDASLSRCSYDGRKLVTLVARSTAIRGHDLKALNHFG